MMSEAVLSICIVVSLMCYYRAMICMFSVRTVMYVYLLPLIT